MNLHNLLTKLRDRRPKITIALMIPPEIIDKGWHNVSITTDNVHFELSHGILTTEYLFRGALKVDAN